MKLASKLFKGKKSFSEGSPSKPAAATPAPVVVAKPAATTTTPTKQNTGYSPDLDLEGRVFKILLAKDGQKEDITASFMAHQVHIDEKSPKRYGFFERGVSLPVHILLATQNFYVIDSLSFEILTKISLYDLKEVIVEISDTGLFCIEAKKEGGGPTDTTKYYFVTSPVTSLLADILTAFQQSAKQSVDKFIVTHRAIFQHSYIERSNNNRIAVGKILDDLNGNGFADTDIWDGSVDLRPWIKKYRNIIQPGEKDQTFVVEFTIVPTGEKVYYKPSEQVSVQKVLEALSVRAKLPAEKLALAPSNGCEMNGAATFGSYGLGLLFDSWQLNVVVKDSIRVPVTVTIPESIVLMEKATTPVVTYRCLSLCNTITQDLVARVCKQVGVSNPHRFTLMHTSDDYGGVFEDNYPLSAHGVNKGHHSLKLLYKRLPVASGEIQKDAEVVVDGIAFLLQAVEQSIRQKKKLKMEQYIRSMVYSIGDTAVEELAKAQSFNARYVCLNDEGKKSLFKLMEELENEELAVYNIPSQRRLMERARDFLWNNIPPAPPMTAPPKKPPPPPVPPKPSSNKNRTIMLRGGVGLGGETEVGPNGELRVRATISIGGTWSGPPGTLDLLAARQKLRPVADRFSGWDKSAENLGLGTLATKLEVKKRNSNEIPPEALELFLKLKKRHQMIEQANSSEDAEDLGD